MRELNQSTLIITYYSLTDLTDGTLDTKRAFLSDPSLIHLLSGKVLHLSADAGPDSPPERLSPASPKTPHRSEKIYG